MKPRTIKIIYWAVTILFSLFMLFSGVSEIMQTAQAQEIMKHLGYPMYVNTIIGVAKVLGAIADTAVEVQDCQGMGLCWIYH